MQACRLILIEIAGFGRKVKVCLLSAVLDTSGLAPDENVSRYTSAQTRTSNDTTHQQTKADMPDCTHNLTPHEKHAPPLPRAALAVAHT